LEGEEEEEEKEEEEATGGFRGRRAPDASQHANAHRIKASSNSAMDTERRRKEKKIMMVHPTVTLSSKYPTFSVAFTNL
jgi:hypothetical protein